MEKNFHILFLIPIMITIQGYMFEIYTMVSVVHGNVDFVLGINYFVKSEEISMIVPIFFCT